MTLDSVPELARRILHLEMELKRVKPSAGTDNAALLKRMSALEGVVARLSKATPTKPQVYTPKPAVRVPKPTDNSLALKLAALERKVERLRVKESPGAWLDWTPYVEASVGSLTSYTSSGRYCRIGKVIICNFSITITDNGTGSVAISTNLPVALSGNAIGVGRENGVSGKELQLYASGTTIVIFDYGNAYPAATGAVLIGSVTYEVA